MSQSSSPDLEQATETSPLISHRDETRYINPEVDRRLALDTSALEDELLTDQVWSNETSIECAYEVVVLLRMMALLRSRAATQVGEVLSPDLDIQRKFEVVGAAVLQCELFLDLPHVTIQGLETFLLEDFSPDDNSIQTTRVLNLLSNPDLRQAFRHHKVLEIVLKRIWRYGSISDQSKRSAHGVLRHISKLCPPRVMHMLDLLLFLIYFVALLDYTVRPPAVFVEPIQELAPGLREVYVMVYAFAQLCKPWEVTSFPFILTLSAFLLCLSSVPHPQDGSYSVLLFTVSLHLLQLHLPRAPSPLLLLPFDIALPLATLVQHGIFKIFLPVIAFFLPALLLALFLLSTSLSDLLHLTNTLASGPSPLEARTAFLTLLAVVFVLLVCSLVMLVLVYPNLSSQDPPPSRWDRFSRPIGSDARTAMSTVVATYAQSTYFPPPLNLLPTIFCIPSLAAGMLGFGTKRSLAWLSTVKEIMWLVFVAPTVFIVSSIYLWGYL